LRSHCIQSVGGDEPGLAGEDEIEGVHARDAVSTKPHKGYRW
jgi:hypothetical protein